jgi:prolyl oligopeptidase
MVRRSVRTLLCGAGFVLGAASAWAGAAGPDYPATAVRPVTDIFHGVKVVDDYRWLEDDSSRDVKRWIADENAFTRRYLDGLAQRPAIAARVGTLLRTAPVRRYNFEYRQRLFALKLQPPKNQPMLVTLPATGDTGDERVVLDLNSLDPSGRTAIDFFRPSFDGRHVVVSLSTNGSEDGTAYVYEVATGRRLDDAIPGVNFPTAGGSVEWDAAGTGFYYTRFPQGDERPPEDRHFFQRFTSTASARPRRATLTSSERNFPASQRSSSEAAAMAAICSRSSATATAARLPTTCAPATVNGTRSPGSGTASSTWSSATMESSTG